MNETSREESRTPPADGRLAPCPGTPNCVSSQSQDPQAAIAPLEFSGPAPDALAALEAVIRRMPRTNIVAAQGNYLSAEFRSWLGFVDDVEFLLDEARQVIDFRSASRFGVSDLGVNRRRMETIRKRFAKAAASQATPQ